MQELQAQSILSLFETNRDQRASFITHVKEAVQEGRARGLNVLLQAKCMAEIAKELCDDPELKALYLAEGEKEGKKFVYRNAEFSVKEAGTKYDYSSSGDTTLDDMQAKYDQLTEKIKARQTFLKAIPEGKEMADPENGNILVRPAKSSTTILAVTLK